MGCASLLAMMLDGGLVLLRCDRLAAGATRK